jgi:hypothetical protein
MNLATQRRIALAAGAKAVIKQQPAAAQIAVIPVSKHDFGVNTGQPLGTTSPQPTAPAYHENGGGSGGIKFNGGGSSCIGADSGNIKNCLAVDLNVLAATSLGRAATQASLRH